MESLMTRTTAPDEGSGRPAFDAQRSTEIRSLLVRTVAGTPRPRPARLSRPAFALAATIALLFAGGVGAGSVVAYDRLSGGVIAQDAAAPVTESTGTGLDGQSLDGFEPRSDSAPATTGSESAGSAASDAGGAVSDAAGILTPVLTLNGELGYAYPGDLEAVTLTLLGASADLDSTAEFAAAAGGVPIYSADGVTVLGYFDPAGLTP
jgi:hypothetical protein